MFWCDEIAAKVAGPQVVNDSKTPSGRVHVGALRGVLIHDAVFRTLKEKGTPVRYLFGVDDYDPVDEIPAGQGEHFEQYRGAPLCNVPPPAGSTASDMAEHFIGEFFDVFRELGVETEPYRMRDVYRSGRFNEAIDAILRNAAAVRRIYKEVSGSERPDDWLPFQVICESCGRIGTTEVTAYDGREVLYACRPDLVGWARGCGQRGKVSPFDGRGKLPWKLEWTAKWHVFGVTIEGAGKDHTTKGGSRDVATRCLREIFRAKAPVNIPYEFFLVGGAKMSSSRGVGAAAREIADLLPPEVLRFLVIRPRPNQPVNFAPDEKYTTKLFNDFDRARWRVHHDKKVPEDEKHVYRLAETAPEGDYFAPGFPLILALLQLPHLLGFVEEIEQRKGAPLTALERKHLWRRVQSAWCWLENYAAEEERLVLQKVLPAVAEELDATQRAFLHRLADALLTAPWEEEPLQVAIFDAARRTPIEQPRAFQAIYRVLLARESGPKAGNLLAFLERDFVVERFRALPYSAEDLWRQTAIPAEVFEGWLAANRDAIASIGAEVASIEARGGAAVAGGVEFSVACHDGKTHLKRVAIDGSGEGDRIGDRARAYVETVARRYGVAIPIRAGSGQAD
jgi:lysyl-tRNA synthetase class 1